MTGRGESDVRRHIHRILFFFDMTFFASVQVPLFQTTNLKTLLPSTSTKPFFRYLYFAVFGGQLFPFGMTLRKEMVLDTKLA